VSTGAGPRPGSSPPGSRPEPGSALDRARASCPKHMTNGPCGGVAADGTCEADAALTCPYPPLAAELPWRNPSPPSQKPPPRSSGQLEARLRAGEVAVLLEAYTPPSADMGELAARYAPYAGAIDAVNLADHAVATPRASTLAGAAALGRAGIEVIANVSCRDRNAIALQGDVLAAASLGVSTVLCLTGDHPAVSGQPAGHPVYEYDAFELLGLVRHLRDTATFTDGRAVETAPAVLAGAGANPFSNPRELQAERVAAKVAAGAEVLLTQGVFESSGLRGFLDDLERFGALSGAWLIAGVAVVTSLEQAEWLASVPGAQVPEELVAALRRTSPDRRRAEGLRRAREVADELADDPRVSGILSYPILDDVEAAGDLASTLSETHRKASHR